MKSIFQKLSVLTFGLAVFLSLTTGALGYSVVALADAGSNASAVCNGVALAGGTTCNAKGSKEANNTVTNTIGSIVNVLSWIVGVVAIVMIIIGGLYFVISSGDATKTARARNTVIYALVGLIVVAAAQGIVHFVLNNL